MPHPLLTEDHPQQEVDCVGVVWNGGLVAKPWYRDVRAWAVIGSLLVIAALDQVDQAVGLRTLLLVPVVASVILGRARWTLGFSCLAVLLFLLESVRETQDAVLFWRRLAVLVLTCAAASVTSLMVQRSNDRQAEESARFRALAAQAEADRAETRAILDSQLDPFVHFTPVRDAHGKVVDLRFAEANVAAFDYNRSTPEKMIGHTFLEFFPGLLVNGPMALYLECATSGTPVILDDYAYPNEILGSERRYDIRAVKTAGGMALTWRDVTERHHANELLADSEKRYRLLAENSSDVIWEVGRGDRIEWSSQSVTPVLGWAASEVIGSVALDFIHPDDHHAAFEARRRVMIGIEIREEYRIRRADGTYRWMMLSARGVPTGDGVTRVVTLRDIDAEVTARENLARIVGRDPLTGLKTREVMEGRIAGVMGSVPPERVAVLCVGVDSLSDVNQAYTHAAGDVVLVTVAARIVSEVGDADNVARGAGVDFIVLAPGEAGAADASILAERIRQVSRDVVIVDDHRIQPTVSIGIATGQTAGDPEQLIRAATLAMRTAKQAGRDRVAFSVPELAAEAERRLTLTSSIADALQAGEFTAWYQPIHDLVTGQLQGYEALARWIQDDGTVIEPSTFMSLIERSPLVARMDEVILLASLERLASVPSGRFIAVNVSARTLSSDAYPELLIGAVLARGVDPTRLHLEITETALLEVSDDVIKRMQRLADFGVDWYVDDFGTGFSSISHLRDLPVRGLKLDISFTRGLDVGDLRCIQLAQALAGLAQGLGLDTVAEGVETREQAGLLSAQGWRHGQGWLFGRAQPGDPSDA